VTITTHLPPAVPKISWPAGVQGFTLDPGVPKISWPAPYTGPMFGECISPPIRPARLPQPTDEEWAAQLSKLFSGQVSNDDDALAALAQQNLGVINNSRAESKE